MPVRAFESASKIVEDFFGGADFSLVRGDATTHDVEQSDNALVKRINSELGMYLFILKRAGLPFTATERKMADEIADAFHIFFANRKRGGDIAYFRTALLSSLLDVSIARCLQFNRYRAFWSIQKLIQILKNLSFQKYEGKPATSGFIVYRTDIEEFNVACSMSDCLRHDFDPGIGVSVNFFKSPFAYRIVNGLGTYYACNINLKTTGMVKFLNYTNRDAIDRLSLRVPLSLLDKAGEGSFAVSVTPASELEVITLPDNIFVWRKGNWSLYDPDIFRSFLSEHLKAKEIKALIATAYSLSKLRFGAIILIADKNILASGDFQKGICSVNRSSVFSRVRQSPT
jgi:hypothetical protein